jgi:hypothetical protein
VEEGSEVSSSTVGIIVVVVVLVALIASTLLARRRGYNMPGQIIVRCSQGHLFYTVWVPGASFKAIRLGFLRFQHCPVGNHWALVAPVKESELSEEERMMADRYHDAPIP